MEKVRAGLYYQSSQFITINGINYNRKHFNVAEKREGEEERGREEKERILG